MTASTASVMTDANVDTKGNVEQYGLPFLAS